MLYINYFEFAAVAIIFIIMGLFLTRRLPVQKSSRIFLYVCIICLVASISDIVSSYTISFPDRFPIWFDYFVSELYLFSYISCILVFVVYIDSLTKIKALEKVILRLVFTISILQMFLIFSSPFNHLFIYLDENLSYQHGPLFIFNYLLALIFMIVSIIIVVKGRVQLSTFQVISLVLFLAGITATVAIQAILPQFLLGGFSVSIMLISLYVAFENPAYYFYQDTRCYNAYSFYRTMRFYRLRNKNVSVVVASINNYDHFSKLLGNTQKNNLSRSIADRLSKNFKRNAFLLSNDQFAVIIKGTTERLDRERELERLLHTIFENRVELSGRSQDIDITTAIIPGKYRFASRDELSTVINMALSLEASKNRSDEEIYSRIDSIIEKKHRHSLVELAIERAFQKGDEGFLVYYQPILNVASGKFESAEALVRLIDSEIGFVPPDEFIPIIEDSGQILELGEIVFRRVCDLLNSIDYKSLGLKYIEVNLSPLQCEDKNIVESLFAIMKNYNIDPSAINFEITETANTTFTEGSTVVNNILEMNRRGISFSIDDFGSGFAAMDHLFQLPVDLVKVDKGILWQAMKDENAMIVLKNTFRMVQELNCKILVEGVETQEMVDILKSYGCNYMQGFFYSKPIPQIEFIGFLAEKNA